MVEKFYGQGQSIWCDNLSRNMIDSGELQRRIDAGVVGVTSNPTIFMKAITGSADYDAAFDRLLGNGLGTSTSSIGLSRSLRLGTRRRSGFTVSRKISPNWFATRIPITGICLG
ncbi:MAG: hypothetical protein IH989_05205 [Planctomycetes bacterium]|nr:hypothetical protein [Planctomycetota bacterium]